MNCGACGRRFFLAWTSGRCHRVGPFQNRDRPHAPLTFRRAGESDLDRILALLADDPLGASRERTDPSHRLPYLAAFRRVDADPNQLLAVAELDGEVVGTLQISFLDGLSRGGMRRGQIEAVRVAAERRGTRIGEALIQWAVDQCRAAGCGLVQLTTDRSRTDAHRFYDRLGFKASHVGYKLDLQARRR